MNHDKFVVKCLKIMFNIYIYVCVCACVLNNNKKQKHLSMYGKQKDLFHHYPPTLFLGSISRYHLCRYCLCGY